jgi:hypothetical protein
MNSFHKNIKKIVVTKNPSNGKISLLTVEKGSSSTKEMKEVQASKDAPDRFYVIYTVITF